MMMLLRRKVFPCIFDSMARDHQSSPSPGYEANTEPEGEAWSSSIPKTLDMGNKAIPI